MSHQMLQLLNGEIYSISLCAICLAEIWKQIQHKLNWGESVLEVKLQGKDAKSEPVRKMCQELNCEENV